ncbi:Uncharacterised protein [Mycobacteroides abscessus subsp. abscessus]|nr:Uncharacterised protein [Mycobacteroides abscessus subsp. abscessus]
MRRSDSADGSFSRPIGSSASGILRSSESGKHRPRIPASSSENSAGVIQLQPLSQLMQRTQRAPSMSTPSSEATTSDLLGRWIPTVVPQLGHCCPRKPDSALQMGHVSACMGSSYADALFSTVNGQLATDCRHDLVVVQRDRAVVVVEESGVGGVATGGDAHEALSR